MTPSRPERPAPFTPSRADAVLLAGIPVVLVLVHFGLPPALRHRLVFDHSAPSLLTMWSSSYVHRSDAHLYGNLVGYAVVVFPTYFIFAYEERRRAFRQLLASFLLGLPFALAAANYAFYQWVLHLPNAANRGFSGIVGALFGLLFASLVGLVYRESGEWVRAFAAGSALILGVLGVIVVYGGIMTGTLGVLLAVGLVASLSALLPRDLVGDRERLRAFVSEHRVPLALGLYGAAVIVVLLPALFPIDWVGTTSVTNIFAHFVGFLLGVGAAGVRSALPASGRG